MLWRSSKLHSIMSFPFILGSIHLFLLFSNTCCLPFQGPFEAGALGRKRFDDGLPFHDKGFQFLAREGLFHQRMDELISLFLPDQYAFQ